MAAVIVAVITSPRWVRGQEWVGAPEWVLGEANAGAAAIGKGVIGTVAIGMAAIGTAAIGTIGTATGITIMVIMSFLSVTSAFHGGGAGVRPGAGAIRMGTDIMVMATRMATATVPRTVTVMATAMEAPNTAIPATVMDMAIMQMDTALPAGPEWLSYSAGSLAPAITTGPSMEFWGPELAELFAHTRLNTATQAEQVSFGYR